MKKLKLLFIVIFIISIFSVTYSQNFIKFQNTKYFSVFKNELKHNSKLYGYMEEYLPKNSNLKTWKTMLSVQEHLNIKSAKQYVLTLKKMLKSNKTLKIFKENNNYYIYFVIKKKISNLNYIIEFNTWKIFSYNKTNGITVILYMRRLYGNIYLQKEKFKKYYQKSYYIIKALDKMKAITITK